MVIGELAELDAIAAAVLGREGLSELVKAAAQMEPGRYMLDGTVVLVQEGLTKALGETEFEAHRKNIDVQVLLSGAELMEWAPIEGLTQTAAYLDERDLAQYAGKGSVVPIRPGMFYMMKPEDGHKACGHTETATAFRKVVIKIPVQKKEV